MQMTDYVGWCWRTPAAPQAPAIHGGRRLWNMATLTFGALLLTVTIGQAQTCLHGPEESPAQRARRNAAIRFVQQVNDAEEKLRLQNRKFGHLDELPGIDAPPVGFVPRLTVDDWSYSIVLKDFFDDCGFIVFSDQDRVIYEGQPVATARRRVTTNKGARGRPLAFVLAPKLVTIGRQILTDGDVVRRLCRLDTANARWQALQFSPGTRSGVIQARSALG